MGYIPPPAARKAAARGLELRKKSGGKGGLSVKQAAAEGIGSGVQRAVNIKNGDALSLETVKRMKAFFDRHSAFKDKHTTDPPSKSYVSWLLWGGNPGYSWAKKIVVKAEKTKNEGMSIREAALLYERMRKPKYRVMGPRAEVGKNAREPEENYGSGTTWT